MARSYLRLEGVNLAHSIGDTEDLATRRGGGLMLLEAMAAIEQQFCKPSPAALKRISTGASAGLFEILDVGRGTANAVLDALQSDPCFCHGTFVADVLTEGSSGFVAATEALIAANRWQQMQRLSFSTVGLAASKSGFCPVDEVRPAHETTTVKREKDTPISKSVSGRRENGMKRKQNFYQRELASLGGDPTSRDYSNNFDQLACKMPKAIRPTTLDGKMAVFYADGNKFGQVAQACQQPGDLTSWDDYIKQERRAFLLRLLRRAATEKSRWQFDDSKGASRVRLETLLWGGDEFMMVVPAWCGIELAELFFDSTANMRYPSGDDGKALSHCCGLVFCHRQAPISGISALAKALAEQGKLMNKSVGKLENRLHWMVLESFDQAGGDMDQFLRRRYPATLPPAAPPGAATTPAVAWSNLMLSPQAVVSLKGDLPTLKAVLPRSAIVHIARRMAEGSGFEIDGAGQTKPHPLVARSYVQVIGALNADQLLKFNALWAALTGVAPANPFIPSLTHLAAWATLAELWDYAVGEPPSVPGNAGVAP